MRDAVRDDPGFICLAELLERRRGCEGLAHSARGISCWLRLHRKGDQVQCKLHRQMRSLVLAADTVDVVELSALLGGRWDALSLGS